jgi:hypothetical protein
MIALKKRISDDFEGNWHPSISKAIERATVLPENLEIAKGRGKNLELKMY